MIHYISILFNTVECYSRIHYNHKERCWNWGVWCVVILKMIQLQIKFFLQIQNFQNKIECLFFAEQIISWSFWPTNGIITTNTRECLHNKIS